LLIVTNQAFAQGGNPAPMPGEAPAHGTAPAGDAAASTGVAMPHTEAAMAATPTGAAPIGGTPESTAGAPAAGSPIASPAAPPPAEKDNGELRLTPASPMKIETPNATLKFGFLFQPQYEALGNAALNGASQNLFVRRTRILVGGTLFKNFEFFFDTDFPNLFKAANAPPGEANPKATPGMNVQDAFGTVKIFEDAIKIDAGYMLPPLAHNALQGAGTLYSWDYFANSFRHSNVFGSTADPVGRDVGAELRGLLVDGIFEYRLGMFQGKREEANPTTVASRNFFRVAGRLQINLLDPESGFFYAGSYLGNKRILSFGGSYDFQDGYHHSSGDAILDLPVGPGVLTAQVDVSHWNGGNWVTLPNQSALMAEVGYLIKPIFLSPIARVERRWVKNETAALPDETRFGGGLAFWPYGHNINLKAFFNRIAPTPGLHDYNQIVLQAQMYLY